MARGGEEEAQKRAQEERARREAREKREQEEQERMRQVPSYLSVYPCFLPLLVCS